MNRCIKVILIVVSVIFLEYIGSLLFHWEFSIRSGLIAGVGTALGFIWISNKKKEDKEDTDEK